ncbi:MAG: hypothetical protein EHM24_23470 [Acidobacteria bacterium]|nr:MAG: hypothetical protein EHM24_23470 [Acidobacteriota bacterium]
MTRGWRSGLALAAVSSVLSATLAGQAAPPKKAQGQPAPRQQAVAPAAAPAPAPLEAYTYRSEGRRDPFVSLVNRGAEAPKGSKGTGIGSLFVGDISLKGIVQSRGAYLAIVQAPDGKRPFIVRVNERFADGVVKAITADSLLILQEVTDPLSLTKQREIRKTLRAVEEVK